MTSLALAAFSAVALAAQPTAPSAAELRRLVEAVAHDSTGGRQTPSSGLDAAGRYVAGEFTKSGLKPIGDGATFFQRYPLTQTVLDVDSVGIRVGPHAAWQLGKDFFFGGGIGDVPKGTLRGPAVVLTGAVNRDSVAALGVRGKVVVYVPPASVRSRDDIYRLSFALGTAGAVGVIVPGRYADTLWNTLRRDPDELKPSVATAWPATTESAPRVRREGIISYVPIIELWRGRMADFLTHLAIDSATLYAPGTAPRVTPVGADAEFRFTRRIENIAWPANVVAVLPGSDPVLRNEYIVFTAHLDGLGQAKNAPPGPQSILNGADDNASGVASMLEIARAFANGATRPKRSLIFAAVSGEELGLWGSDYLSTRLPVPHSSVVANINLDMIGRAQGDTLYVTGRDTSAVGRIADAAVRRNAHGMRVLDERAMDARYPGQSYDTRSDHANFRRRGIPAIAFFTGPHADYHETTDDADKVNYEALRRVTQLAYDIAAAIANAPRLPAPR
jgi:hypothetical protein